MRLLFCCILAIPLLLKASYAEKFIFHYTNTDYLGFFQSLSHDCIFFSVIWLLLTGSTIKPEWRLINALLRLLAMTLFLVFIIDYIIILQFNTHLALGDFVKYASYSFQYVQQLSKIPSPALMVISVLVCLPLLIFALWRFQPNHKPFYRTAFGLLVISGLSLFTNQNNYAHAWIYKNVVDYNLTILSESSPYSPEFVQQLNYQETQQCHTLPCQQKNIIILMVESLSNYQSQYFSGLNNWTPELDAIAQQHLAYKNFYANGFITEDGEIALLTGLLPLYPPSSYSDDGGTSFHGFFNLKHSLPRVLAGYGYHSDFLTTADLEFGQTGAWAKSIGFNYVEGHDHPEYDHWERFHFRSAPDEALYKRALARVDEQGKQPFLLFMKTVSSHHPYQNPETHSHSEAEVFAYTDKQIGRFYRQLLERGFFNNGWLFIVGDHHSMTPLRKAEIELYGQQQASAKVPLVIVGAQASPKSVSQPFQQTDVFNSITGVVSGQQCHSDWQGQLWGANQHNPKFIVHRRGDNRDQISVFTQDSAFLIKMDGDASRLLDPATAPEQQTLLDKINATRIARSQAANESH